MNLFEKILTPQARQSFSQTGQAIQNTFAPVTQVGQQATQSIKPIANTFGQVGRSVAKPFVDNYNYTKKVNQYYSPYRDAINKLGLTPEDIAQIPEDKKEAILNGLRELGVTLPEMPAPKSTNPIKNKDVREGVIQNVGLGITDLFGGAVAEVPSVIGQTSSFLTKASQYNPATYLGGQVSDIVTAPFSDKTYGELRNERSAGFSDLGNSMASAGKTGTEFLQKYGPIDPTSIPSKIGGVGTDIASSVIGPNKIGILKKGAELYGLGKNLATAAKIGDIALEGGLAGAKYDIASEGKITPESVEMGALGNVGIAGAFKLGKKVAQVLTPKTAEQKALESLGGKTVNGIINGKTVKIQEPKEGIIAKISSPIRPKDPKVLTGRALTPSYAGKSDKQKMSALGKITENVKEFYNQVRTGRMKGNINTLEDSANTVISNLDDIGGKIGKAVEKAEGTLTPSVGILDNISNTLGNEVEKLSGAYKSLENFSNITKNPLSLQDAFKAKKVFQTEIGKLIRSGDSGTDSYSSLVKGVQELSDNIDTMVEKSIGTKQFLEWKKQYRLLKSIVKDMSNSAVVEGRRSPQTFVEQLGMLESITEGITNPLSTARNILAKEIGELNTRGGAWKELIKNYDKEAIGKAQKVVPKKITK